jgi:hypothetical protein
MSVILLPGARLRNDAVERSALRAGVSLSRGPAPVRVIADQPVAAFCAGCAGPIEFGPVLRGRELYCSVECSLGGDQPA